MLLPIMLITVMSDLFQDLLCFYAAPALSDVNKWNLKLNI